MPRLGRAEAGFPRRPVSIIVPFTPGGSTDQQMRALAEAATHGGDLAKSGYGEALLRLLGFEGASSSSEASPWA